MKKVTSELVLLFKEDGVPVAILYENGAREIYTLKRATKEQLVDLFDVDKVTEF